MKPVSLTSNNKFKDLKFSPHCHNLIVPFRDPRNHNWLIPKEKKYTIDNKRKDKDIIWYDNTPDATKSVFNNVAILEIHIGWPLISSFPCASGIEHSGFFFKHPQTQSCPSSPPLKKFSSLMSLTASMLLPTLLTLNINCDSSTIFHILIVPS